MQIEIDVPRPGLTALLVTAIVAGAVYVQWQSEAASVPQGAPQVQAAVSSASQPVTPVGVPTMAAQSPVVPMVSPYGFPSMVMNPYAAMYGMVPQAGVSPWLTMGTAPTLQGQTSSVIPERQTEADRVAAEAELAQQKLQQAIIDQRKNVLENQMRILEDIQRAGGMTVEQRAAYEQSVRELASLMQDTKRSEQEMLDSYTQIKQSEDDLIALTKNANVQPGSQFCLMYPVDVTSGITAYFHDPSYPYASLIGAHDGIDIRAAQSTPIHAPGDGVVIKAEDHGYGYNSIVIQHPDGRSTLVGHVSKILVSAGQAVHRGDIIGKSGGMPGTPGAGSYTTGPHVHFSVYRGGNAVNPIDEIGSCEP